MENGFWWIISAMFSMNCGPLSALRPQTVDLHTCILSGRTYSRQQTSWVLYNWLQVNTAYCTLDCRPWSKAIYNVELWLQNSTCRPYTADVSLQTTGCRTQSSLAAELDLQTSDCRPQTVDFRLQTSTCRPQTADLTVYRTQPADFRLWIVFRP